jgi:hypothetical protein
VEEGGWDFLDMEKCDDEDEEDEESDGETPHRISTRRLA